MTLVLLSTEDATGGGLQRIVVKAAQAQRAQRSRPPLKFPAKHSTVNGNAALLADCEKYPKRRRSLATPFDHVVYIMDARRAWEVVPGAERPQPGHLQEGLAVLERQSVSYMEKKARGTLDDPEWTFLRPGFHAHLLVWERESLILPVMSHFRLGEDVIDVVNEHKACEVLEDRSRRHARYGYSKANAGALYLDEIAESAELRQRVLDSNESLQRIVTTLVEM